MDPLSGIENSDPDSNCSFSNLKKKFRIKGFQIILQRFDVALHFIDAKAVSDNSATLLDCSQTDIEYPLELETIGTAFQIKENSTETSVYLEETGEVLPIQKDPLSTQKDPLSIQKDPLSEENCTSNFKTDRNTKEKAGTITNDNLVNTNSYICVVTDNNTGADSKEANEKNACEKNTDTVGLSSSNCDVDMISLEMNDRMKEVVNNKEKLNSDHVTCANLKKKNGIVNSDEPNNEGVLTLERLRNKIRSVLSRDRMERCEKADGNSKGVVGIINDNELNTNTCIVANENIVVDLKKDDKKITYENSADTTIQPAASNETCVNLEVNNEIFNADKQNADEDSPVINEICVNLKVNIGIVNGNELNADGVSTVNQERCANVKANNEIVRGNELDTFVVSAVNQKIDENLEEITEIIINGNVLNINNYIVPDNSIGADLKEADEINTCENSVDIVAPSVVSGEADMDSLEMNDRIKKTLNAEKKLNSDDGKCTNLKVNNGIVNGNELNADKVLAVNQRNDINLEESEKSAVSNDDELNNGSPLPVSFVSCSVYERSQQRTVNITRTPAGESRKIPKNVSKSRRVHKSETNDTNYQVWTCSECNKLFVRKCDLLRHSVTHEKRFTCAHCNNAFTTKKKMRYHIMRIAETPLFCRLCNKELSNLASLKNHEKNCPKGTTKVNKRVYPSNSKSLCYICGRFLAGNREFQNHIMIHLNERPLSCDICSKKFITKDGLIRHMKYHLYDKQHSCSTCNKSFFDERGLQMHMLIHSDVRPFKCDMCDHAYVRKSSLKLHKQIHKEVRPFACDVCHKRFYCKRYLNTHKLNHSDHRPYLCEFCSKGFILKCYLEFHLKCHRNERPFVCDICKASFVSSTTLKSHQLIHKNERPFVCSICQKTFITKGSLKIHFERHGDVEKPFTCSVCPKAFPQRQMLQRHILVHTLEQPHMCTVCSRSFNQKSSLVRHMRIHNNERPYICAVCDRSFIQKGCLEVHCRSHMRKK